MTVRVNEALWLDSPLAEGILLIRFGLVVYRLAEDWQEGCLVFGAAAPWRSTRCTAASTQRQLWHLWWLTSCFSVRFELLICSNRWNYFATWLDKNRLMTQILVFTPKTTYFTKISWQMPLSRLFADKRSGYVPESDKGNLIFSMNWHDFH